MSDVWINAVCEKNTRWESCKMTEIRDLSTQNDKCEMNMKSKINDCMDGVLMSAPKTVSKHEQETGLEQTICMEQMCMHSQKACLESMEPPVPSWFKAVQKNLSGKHETSGKLLVWSCTKKPVCKVWNLRYLCGLELYNKSVWKAWNLRYPCSPELYEKSG